MRYDRRNEWAEVECSESRRGPGEDGQCFRDEATPDREDHRYDDDRNHRHVDEREGKTHDSILARARGRVRPSAPAKAASSLTFFTSIIRKPALSNFAPFGTTAVEKPNFDASLRRNSGWGAGLTSPERLISPKYTVSRGSGSPI